MVDQVHIENLKGRIREIQESLPAHSVPAAMLIELEDLEEQLADLLAEGEGGHAPA
jgi:hypothetical protein